MRVTKYKQVQFVYYLHPSPSYADTHG